jgi:hypothetical protein
LFLILGIGSLQCKRERAGNNYKSERYSQNAYPEINKKGCKKKKENIKLKGGREGIVTPLAWFYPTGFKKNY